MLNGKTIGFMGAGNMAEALINGIISSGLVPAGNILAFDVREARLNELKEKYGVTPCRSNRQLAAESAIVILAVKPQNVPELLGEMAGSMNNETLLISIAAGISIPLIDALLKKGGADLTPKVIRVMPNTPALVKEGAAALVGGPGVTNAEIDMALKLFDAVGKAVAVSETLMNAVTGLSGSGPAYVCLMLEAMSEAGVKAGLPEDVSSMLSLQTIVGTARLLEETGKLPSELREMVSSPGGTTIEGLKALERGKFKEAVIDAVRAATERARELGSGAAPDRK